MEKHEWLRRYKEELVRVAQDGADAVVYAEVSVGFEEDPEGAAYYDWASHYDYEIERLPNEYITKIVQQAIDTRPEGY
jgi:hypothetical protein